MVRVAVGILISSIASWALFIAALALWRPRGLDLREAKRLVPDVVRLLRALVADRTLRGPRRRIAMLLAYLSLPFDVVPDFVPVLGYADDVVMVALVLRSVVRQAGPEALERHWDGTATGLAIIRRLCGVPD